MNAIATSWVAARSHSGAGGPLYRVKLATDIPDPDREIRAVIERNYGDLRGLYRNSRRQARQIHIHLGARRLDDVLVALETAGFAVDAVVSCAGGFTES